MLDLFYRGIVLLSGNLIHFYDFILSLSASVHIVLDTYRLLFSDLFINFFEASKHDCMDFQRKNRNMLVFIKNTFI